MIDENVKKWIDTASYTQLLERWRFAPIGDPLFQDEVGEYYKQVIAKRRAEVGDEGHTAASKQIGWER